MSHDTLKRPAARTGPPARRRITLRPGAWLTWAVLAFFFVNLVGVIATVLLNSFGRRWFDSWLPDGWTSSWYKAAWKEFNLGPVLWTTVEVTFLVVALSLALAVPASYALARRNFPGKKILTMLFVLPILVPPIAYGIPLATVLYKFHLAGTVTGVVLANLVPSVPFVIFTMTPFIEQIDPKIEAAARMCGAGTWTVLSRILSPLLLPGMLAAGILVMVRTFGMFELTFLTSGPSSQTLTVDLFSAVNSAGIRATQSIDAMAVIYTASMTVLLLVALRFVNPTQLVARSSD
ncbi:spermidine/putrescine ABC transporter permease [Kitasatospora herbaricolor]|uniref:ABC transporter permease n=1 Tax=Kitasatospora herbaricolor TaxID=68217 RepID=UPI00174B8D74|nr:ABC transporter permease [Kitasatospora herbaricolor]MDQ0313377.1 putative spermidine/putrescine transport system permease protein [Kitasatospora herbaricolor]GGV47771.1 spermidine/putrescine ABC transporter permease [Kitasatospora herbaricolor]